MKYSLSQIEARALEVRAKLDSYLSMKRLNEEQRIDFQDLQEELTTLKRFHLALSDSED